MRVLLSNDDGLHAPGLKIGEAIANEIAGPDGEVWVVAPEMEQSGVGHCISYTQPCRVVEYGPRHYAIDGTPADCVIVAVHGLMPEPPDVILSGVNRGYNIAEDVVYSGTVGAAMEGALHGFKSIALSQYYVAGGGDEWAVSRAKGAEAVRKALAAPWDPDLFYSINFPAGAPEAVKGWKVAAQGRRKGAPFSCTEHRSASGRLYYWLGHATDNASAGPGSDAVLTADGWITVTPLRPHLTAHDVMDGARAAVE